jgi:hypothetical protein
MANKERKEAAECLLEALQSSGLTMPLLITIAQQMADCAFTREAHDKSQIRFASWLHRQAQESLQVIMIGNRKALGIGKKTLNVDTRHNTLTNELYVDTRPCMRNSAVFPSTWFARVVDVCSLPEGLSRGQLLACAASFM